jgi:hypothetical protein
MKNMELELGLISVDGKEGLPIWTIVHFFERTISNHMKITTIQRICELSANGVPDEHFFVAKDSADVYQSKPIDVTNLSSYIVLESKANSPENFWNHIGNLKRPIVFYDDGFKRIPLYDFTYEEALRITYFRENSPFHVKFKGAISPLLDLFNYRSRENEIERRLNRIERIIKTSELIEESHASMGIKIYAREQLSNLLESQDKLNQRVGINHVSIDITNNIIVDDNQ